MKFSWLEKMVKEGQVRREVADRTYADCAMIVKESGQLATKTAEISLQEISKDTNPLVKLMGLGIWAGQKSLPLLIPAVTAVSGAMAVEEVKSWALRRRYGQALEDSKRKLMEMDEFKSEPEKAMTCFREIASHAPAVAMNTNLAARLMKRSLKDGLTDTDVEKLVSLQAQSMSGGADQFMGKVKVAQEECTVSLPAMRPEVTGMLCADIMFLCKNAGVEPTKTLSFMRQYLPAVGAMALGSALGGVMTGGVNALRAKIQSSKLKEQLDHSFAEALKNSDPDKEPLHANQEQAREAFKALAHFAPHVALQPQAARSFMNKIVSYGQNYSVSDLKDLTEIQKNVSNSRGEDPFITGLVEGSKFFGMDRAMGSMHGEVSKAYGRDIMTDMGLAPGKNQGAAKT